MEGVVKVALTVDQWLDVQVAMHCNELKPVFDASVWGSTGYDFIRKAISQAICKRASADELSEVVLPRADLVHIVRAIRSYKQHEPFNALTGQKIDYEKIENVIWHGLLLWGEARLLKAIKA